MRYIYLDFEHKGEDMSVTVGLTDKGLLVTVWDETEAVVACHESIGELAWPKHLVA